MQSAIRVIHDEHRALAAVLHGLVTLAHTARDSRVQPEFTAFRAMIHYIDSFPERLHHPKEEKFLFARLAERAPEALPVIEALRAEHVRGARLIREVEKALLDYELEGAKAVDAFVAAVDGYVKFHRAHMRREEGELLPIAERRLTAEDWSALDAAFAGNNDPIADMRELDFDRLFTKIVSLAPAPVGLGEPWRKAGAPRP